MKFIIQNCSNQNLALKNCIFFPRSSSWDFSKEYVEVFSHTGESIVLNVSFDDKNVSNGYIGLNNVQRCFLRVSSGDSVQCTLLTLPTNTYNLSACIFEINTFIKTKFKEPIEIDHLNMVKYVFSRFSNHIFTINQTFLVEYEGVNYVAHVKDLSGATRGQFVDTCDVTFESGNSSNVKIVDTPSVSSKRKKFKDMVFSKIGIGGLDEQFETIFRRVFVSREYPLEVVRKLGISHVKGILLHGPPGTGKTLIARQIGKLLSGKPPKIINGPELFNKFTGESEKNVREIFKDAENDEQKYGENSDLHVIIFDEIDAVCNSRGTTVVNQLLTKIDGVDSLNNILVIGMTNRIHMLDEALLRPGRLEVHIEISIPNLEGREQIFKIHTNKMDTNSFIDKDVDMFELAKKTKNFSGAEIEAVVKSATSFSLARHYSTNNEDINIRVCNCDFENALKEIVPAFGSAKDAVSKYIVTDCTNKVEQCINMMSKGNSVLIYGTHGSGKTSLAATLALNYNFPYTRILSQSDMTGLSEIEKNNEIINIFKGASKSTQSVIIIDDIERLVDYVPLTNNLSNMLFNTLYNSIKAYCINERILIGTTNKYDLVEQMDMMCLFKTQIAL